MTDSGKTKTTRGGNREGLRRFSISRIKREMSDVFYLSDDLVITTLDAQRNTTADYPVSIDGFSAVIMMAGEATVSIDMQNYQIRPNTIVFFNPDAIIRTVKCSANAAAYVLAFSKSFVNEIQIDLSTSLPVYMRFGKAPVLEVRREDVDEIRQLFQLIKTMLRSDKERYRHEIIRTLFTTAFYIITEINQREEPRPLKQGRSEVLFDEFMSLLQQYNKRERNVGFYAKQLKITPKYLSAVVKEVSGKTAARWIDESVILEAKALLKYSGMSIQEIAYHPQLLHPVLLRQILQAAHRHLPFALQTQGVADAPSARCDRTADRPQTHPDPPRRHLPAPSSPAACGGCDRAAGAGSSFLRPGEAAGCRFSDSPKNEPLTPTPRPADA